MKNWIQFYLIFAAILLGGSIAASAQSGEPIGPPKPVIVVNSPENPVPVVGTVNGNVSVNGSVSITNSPTVKIDSTANTVKVDSGSNEQLLYLNDYDFSGDLLTGIGPIDVSKYKQIRVSAVLYGSSEGYLNFIVGSVLPDGGFLGLDEKDISLDPGDRYVRVFDVPGRSVKILLGATPGKRIGRVAIFGR